MVVVLTASNSLLSPSGTFATFSLILETVPVPLKLISAFAIRPSPALAVKETVLSDVYAPK